ncbi:MAG: hypothetical protein ABFS42_02775 [Candidatus Krumholzibacteriota bacterium]
MFWREFLSLFFLPVVASIVFQHFSSSAIATDQDGHPAAFIPERQPLLQDPVHSQPFLTWDHSVSLILSDKKPIFDQNGGKTK